MAAGEYLTLAARAEAETRVRGSRFLAVALPVATEAQARDELDARSRVHFDATHHCAAWRLRNGDWRALDAGEPGGSAGAPILAAIDAEELLDSAVIVTRYFGGTKLGVGGLARAYGEAAAAVLALAPRTRAIDAARVLVRYGHEHTGAVMRALERFQPSNVLHGFDPESALPVTRFVVPAAEVDAMGRQLAEQTAGSVQLETTGSTVLHRPVST